MILTKFLGCMSVWELERVCNGGRRRRKRWRKWKQGGRMKILKHKKRNELKWSKCGSWHTSSSLDVGLHGSQRSQQDSNLSRWMVPHGGVGG